MMKGLADIKKLHLPHITDNGMRRGSYDDIGLLPAA